MTRVASRRGGRIALLSALCGFRVVLPLIVLAASGHAVVGLPRYVYDPLSGDAYGYYSATRELLGVSERDAVLVALAVGLAGIGVFVVRRVARGRQRTAAIVAAVTWGLALVAAVLAGLSRSTGAGTLGWPLLWSVPLAPYRALGLPLDPDVAFVFGLALSLAAIVVAVVATYALALFATRRRGVALLAASLYALWPLIVVPLGGSRGSENGTWQGEIGLSLYTEPLSTALVTSALALVLAPRAVPATAALAGSLLGFAVAVRLSNGLVLACVLVAVALRRPVHAAWLAVAAAAFAPLVAAYWSKGYVPLSESAFPTALFSLDRVVEAWTDSLLWRPRVLLALVPLAVVGTARLTRPVALLLWACVLSTAAFYSTYAPTPMHPRFLFVVLPIVLVLCAAGLAELAERAASLARRGLRTGAAAR